MIISLKRVSYEILNTKTPQWISSSSVRSICSMSGPRSPPAKNINTITFINYVIYSTSVPSLDRSQTDIKPTKPVPNFCFGFEIVGLLSGSRNCRGVILLEEHAWKIAPNLLSGIDGGIARDWLGTVKLNLSHVGRVVSEYRMNAEWRSSPDSKLNRAAPHPNCYVHTNIKSKRARMALIRSCPKSKTDLKEIPQFSLQFWRIWSVHKLAIIEKA